MADETDQEPADELPPLPGEVVEVVRAGGRLKWIAAFVGAIAVIAGLVVVVGGGNDIDADEALEKAQAFVEDAESYRFEILDTRRSQLGDPEGPGSDTTTRSLATGQVADADHWHLTEQEGIDTEVEYETIKDGDVVYSSYWGPEVEDGVDSPHWMVGDASEPMTIQDLVDMYSYEDDQSFEELDEYELQYEAEERLDLAMAAYMPTIGDLPQGTTRLVTEATDPVVEEQLADGGVRLRVRLAPIPELAELADPQVPPVDLLLDLDEARHPVEASFKAAVEGASSDVRVRFSGWGGPVEVSPPAEEDIDRTPWIDEQLLAAHPELLVAPAELPEGWAFTYASSSPFEDVFGIDGEQADGCRVVELGYSSLEEIANAGEPPEDPEEYFAEMELLSAMVMTRACSEQLEEDGLGNGAGMGFLPSDLESINREVEFEDLVVTISTTLDDETAIDRMAGSLRRMSVEELAAMIPPDVAGGWGAIPMPPMGFSSGAVAYG
jgi:hypothetical protein